MNARRNLRACSLGALPAVVLLLVLGTLLKAGSPPTTKPAAAPAKPAAPAAKPTATPAKPGGTTAAGTGHPGTATTTHGSGITTGGGSHVTTSSHVTTAGHTTVSHTTTVTHIGGLAHEPIGSHTIHTGGNEVRMRPNGRPGDVHIAGRGMDIHHGLDGHSRVMEERRDGSRIFAERGRGGYVEHPFHYGGRDYAHRSYYYHGRAYDRFYGRYYYRGVYVNYYAPAFYYRPAFYGWAYNPWVAPINYSWGWAGNPWYGYYGYYFTPYPVYPSASVWLADYLIATSLQAAYQAQAVAAAQAAAAQGPPPGAVGLTPDVKDMISAEVQRQISLENQEAQNPQTAAPDPQSSSIQRMLSDGVPHVFVAGQSLDVVNTAGAECAISEGDALQLSGPNPPDAPAVNLVVLSSKGGQECQKGVGVSVQVADLQEMQNHMRETIDQGMGDLKAKQGSGGLPALPMSASGPPVKAGFVAAAPPPDPNAATEINQEAQAADTAEKQVLAETQQGTGTQQLASNSGPASANAPATATAEIKLGQTIDEVTAALGQPVRQAIVGPKTIYVYKDMKITFKDGKVSGVDKHI